MLVFRQTEGSLQTIYEVKPDKSSNNPDCLWVSIGQLVRQNALECFTEWQYSLLKWIVSETVDSYAPLETTPILIETDSSSSRRRIWKRMFPRSPVPDQDDNAVDECFGMLSDLFGDETEPGEALDQILREVKGK